MSENNNQVANEAPELSLSEILQIRRDKLSNLQAQNRDPFEEVKFERDSNSNEIVEKFEELEGSVVKIAGRMMLRREMGKASFADLRDREGKIQVYIKIDDVGEEVYNDFRKWDIGDIFGVEGTVFRTRRGEISVHAKSIKLLSKSLLPLPEKFHGLKDIELRYRERYVDLIVNPDIKDVFIKRTKIISAIRDFLDNRGYLEVETPILSTISGGANARPFITHHNTLGIDMYLRIATELHLKRLIVGGLEKVYEIGRLFRNEGMSIKHNPEFTTIELYEAYEDYHHYMRLLEELIPELALKVCGSYKVTYGDREIDFTAPWKKMSMIEAVREYAGVDFDAIETDEEAQAACKAANIPFEGKPSRGELISIAFEEKAEDKLVSPTFITEHPVEISPLSKRCVHDKRLTDRFELFANGWELANGFSELNDPIDQKERFERQQNMRDSGDAEAGMMDHDFIKALEYGMPPTVGLGVGIDRLVMMLTNSQSIRDVLLFPTMKPINE